MSEQKHTIRYIIIYLAALLPLANLCWFAAYSNQESDYAAMLVVAASFLPMALTLILAKISGEGWNHLGIIFNLKKSWKTYLLSIVGTVLLTYLADPFMLLFFPEKVSTSFTPAELPSILLYTLLGTACFIECLGEELGWISYLFPKLEAVLGTYVSCFLLGLIRGVYHLGILVVMEFPVTMFVEITLSNICLQPFLIYLFKKSGSVFPCSISHGISNLMPIFLVYESGWYYKNPCAILLCMIPSLMFGVGGIIGIRKLKANE